MTRMSCILCMKNALRAQHLQQVCIRTSEASARLGQCIIFKNTILFFEQNLMVYIFNALDTTLHKLARCATQYSNKTHLRTLRHNTQTHISDTSSAKGTQHPIGDAHRYPAPNCSAQRCLPQPSSPHPCPRHAQEHKRS